MIWRDGWLTKRGKDRYMITSKEPTICFVDGTERLDAYVTPGDSLGQNNVCRMALAYNGGQDIPLLQPIPIKIPFPDPLPG